LSDGRGHDKVSVAVRPAAGADAAVEHGMGTYTVQTNTDVESLIVKAMGIINDVYRREGDFCLVVKPALLRITVRSITANENECTVIFYNVETMMDVAEFTVTDYNMPSWHDIQEQIAISI
jgi:hypothetical protein